MSQRAAEMLFDATMWVLTVVLLLVVVSSPGIIILNAVTK
jgi:hypothetical protein